LHDQSLEVPLGCGILPLCDVLAYQPEQSIRFIFWSRNLRDLISDGSKRGILACAAAAKPQGNHAEFDVADDDFASGLY